MRWIFYVKLSPVDLCHKAEFFYSLNAARPDKGEIQF